MNGNGPTDNPTGQPRDPDAESTGPLPEQRPGDDPPVPSLVGRTIGHYRILREIGRGGMGMVYEAEQEFPRRTVALKVINPGVVSGSALQRFVHESQTLARLQHPNIAYIFEAGTADIGGGSQPFFAMEFVQGRRLNDYVEATRPGTRERLALFVKICRAVQYAHQKGVIHRDLKPGNIVVTDEGEPKILDFGVARTTDSDIQSSTLRTDIGQLIGTIPYMSPEQAGGDPDDLDTRSDVYALGVVCYELLSGRLPYDIGRKMIHEAVRVIREDEPTRLSSINRTLRGDIEIIVGKALAKEKDRRYQSAQEFAADIERYLNDEPIIARPPSTAYQLRKFTRRNKALVSGVAATFVALIAGLVGVSAMYLRAEEARAETALERDRLELVAEFQATQLSEIDPAMMGLGIRDSVLDKLRAILEQRALDEEEVTNALRDLESSLAGVNFTNVALESLDEHIFERALASIEEQFSDEPLLRARLIQSVATTLHSLGVLDHALEVQERVQEIRRAELGDQHVDTLESIHALGVILMKLERYEQAKTLLEEAYESRRITLGEGDVATLTTLYELGNLARDTGEIQLAHDRFVEVLTRRQQVLGDDHVDTYVAMAGLASSYWAAGDQEQAESLLQEAVEGLRRTSGEISMVTLVATNNLALVQIGRGRLKEAEEVLRHILRPFRREKGDAHPSTLMTMANIGMALFYQENYESAVPVFREVRESRLRLYGEHHSHTRDAKRSLLMSLHYVGYDYRNVGRLEDAVNVWQESLEMFRQFRDDPDYLEELAKAEAVLRQAKAEYGKELTAAGRFAEAETQLLEAYPMYLSGRGLDSSETQAIIEWLIDLYDRWHEHDPQAGHDQSAAQWRARLQEIHADPDHDPG